MVESALILPVVIWLILACLDLARYNYVQGVLVDEAQRAARAAAVVSNRDSDCPSLQDTLNHGNGIITSPDPNSIVGDPQPGQGQPNGPSTPPTGTGYVYIFPAVAKATPQLSSNNCQGSNRISGVVTVQTTYRFQPWAPILGQFPGPFTMQVWSTQPTEY